MSAGQRRLHSRDHPQRSVYNVTLPVRRQDRQPLCTWTMVSRRTRLCKVVSDDRRQSAINVTPLLTLRIRKNVLSNRQTDHPLAPPVELSLMKYYEHDINTMEMFGGRDKQNTAQQRTCCC